jgi:hypothetical protein
MMTKCKNLKHRTYCMWPYSLEQSLPTCEHGVCEIARRSEQSSNNLFYFEEFQNKQYVINSNRKLVKWHSH